MFLVSYFKKGITMNNEIIARVAHDVNKAYCEAIGDFSQKAWADAPEWARESAINGVKFHRENPNASPSASHDIWLKEKEDTGWKFGAKKDAEKKEHPCFLPYDQLPKEQQIKDHLFKAVVASLLSM